MNRKRTDEIRKPQNMRTVKEVSEITGISVRTLHWYDEIGLLAPTATSEAGYRLYDDGALETLHQILFFREFDMPLREIKSIMENPCFDREALLRSQKKILEQKKVRLERLIAGIDDILKGENKMDFEIFSEADIRQLYQNMTDNMSGAQKQVLAERYGSMEAFEEHFMENAKSPQAQENYAKVVEWYGGKDAAIEASEHPLSREIMEAYSKRLETVMEKLSEKRGEEVSSFAVRELIGEYDFVSKQLYRMKDVSVLVQELAERYRTDERMQKILDRQYGNGTAAFFADAVEAFYKA